jgi:hypothetical protein
MQTTNMDTYKPWKQFKVTSRMEKPEAELVKTTASFGHFTTTNKQEYFEKSYRAPEVDFIPYP